MNLLRKRYKKHVIAGYVDTGTSDIPNFYITGPLLHDTQAMGLRQAERLIDEAWETATTDILTTSLRQRDLRPKVQICSNCEHQHEALNVCGFHIYSAESFHDFSVCTCVGIASKVLHDAFESLWAYISIPNAEELAFDDDKGKIKVQQRTRAMELLHKALFGYAPTEKVPLQ